jgi:hypothetical protein
MHANCFNYSFRRTLTDDMSCCLIPCSVRTCRNEYARFVKEAVSATGGSAMKAVEVLMEHGVPEERIIFVNLVRLFATCCRYRAPLITATHRLRPRKGCEPSAPNTH